MCRRGSIYLYQKRDKWQTFVKTVINLGVSQKAESSEWPLTPEEGSCSMELEIEFQNEFKFTLFWNILERKDLLSLRNSTDILEEPLISTYFLP